MEREAVLDARSARWAGSITLGETELRCEGAQTVAAIKARLEASFGVQAAEQRLGTEEGQLLRDEQKLLGDQTVGFQCSS